MKLFFLLVFSITFGRSAFSDATPFVGFPLCLFGSTGCLGDRRCIDLWFLGTVVIGCTIILVAGVITIVSVVIAFVVGFVAVAWLLRFVAHHAMYWFVGYRVILANSNPATIMTDPDFADATYVEPLDADILTEGGLADQKWFSLEEFPDLLMPEFKEMLEAEMDKLKDMTLKASLCMLDTEVHYSL